MISTFAYIYTPNTWYRLFGLLLFIAIFAIGCLEKEVVPTNVSLDGIAENEKVKQYMEAFMGRGITSDRSAPLSTENALNTFSFSKNLEMNLILSEPRIH